jgi:deoxyribodipyrimidine photo-lyase
MKKYQRILFVFRRDLRLEDNTALQAAMTAGHEVLPVFIVDDRQVKNNEYRSEAAVQFLAESLFDVHEALSQHNGVLFFGKGVAEKEIIRLAEKNKCDAIYFNRDYTPFARQRDQKIIEAAQKKNIVVTYFDDALLCTPEQVHKDDGGQYTVFTPFYKKAQQVVISKERPFTADALFVIQQKGGLNRYSKISDFYRLFGIKYNAHVGLHGGRKAGIALLKQALQEKNYERWRDFPARDVTTHLSAHNKFGTLSIREVYHLISTKFGVDHTLIRELFWRDFYYHIVYWFPYVIGQSFQPKYRHLAWSKSKKNFKRWCDGMTGFPIVDAGMRQLNETGYMHNRVRMIVASFLVKDLHINWQWGEKYFAQKLIDYDMAVNNGSWQWAASTGCDAQPYFRIFNPWLQQKKFDPDAEYIKRWIPELRDMPVGDIHNWFKKYDHYESPEYPQAMLDHKLAAQQAKVMFQAN